MTHKDWIDQTDVGLKAAAYGDDHGLAQGTWLDGWQMAGVFLLFALLSQVIVSRTSEDFTEGLVAIVLSAPLLAWLFIPLQRSDDLLDEANRRRAEFIDALALVLIWTWPLTCCAPLVALVRCIQMFAAGGL
jgi:hypothetical protein